MTKFGHVTQETLHVGGNLALLSLFRRRLGLHACSCKDEEFANPVSCATGDGDARGPFRLPCHQLSSGTILQLEYAAE